MILTGPVFEALKKGLPNCHITVLAPPQSADFARRDPYVDEVLLFDRRKEYPGLNGLRRFVDVLRSKGFQRSYSFHRSPRTSLMLYLAGIPERVGYGDALLAPLSTRRIWKTARYHEVIRNLELVYDDLLPNVQSEVDALKKIVQAPVSDVFYLLVPA